MHVSSDTICPVVFWHYCHVSLLKWPIFSALCHAIPSLYESLSSSFIKAQAIWLWKSRPLSVCWPFQGREGKHTLSPKPCMLDKSQMHPPIIQHVGKGETGLHGPINRPLSSAAAVVVKIICRSMVGNFPPLSQVLEMSLLPNICLAIVTNLINKWFGTSWFCHYCQNVTHGVVTVGGHICITSPALLLDLLVFMESWGSFQGEEDCFRLPPWAFCLAKYGWKSFFYFELFSSSNEGFWKSKRYLAQIFIMFLSATK